MALQAGDTVGSYTVVGTIGKGGMATVYEAKHNRLDRDVALKIMHPSLLQDDNFRARFEREARIVASLDHSNIVSIYDFDEHDDKPYLAMKHIKGMTLKRYALKNGLTPEKTGELLTKLAHALDYAHEKGILHRDLKPSNILIDMDGNPHLTDFGLARIAKSGESTMSQDMMLGTPYYISPEQAQGASSVDHRTDIYSLGVILYELVSGQVPFTGDTPYAIVHGHIYEIPTPASTYNGELSPAVDAVIAKALAKDPNERYDTATEMIQAYQRALTADESLHSAITPIDLPLMGQNRTPTDSTKPIINAPKEKNNASKEYNDPDDGRRMKIEKSFDMGNIDFGELGRRFGTGVQNFASMIEEKIDSELRDRGGRNMTEEERIRRHIEKRMTARNELFQHAGTYLIVNGVLLFIWLMTGAGFPWPIFPIFFWGMGLFGQGVEYYQKYGKGRERKEAAIEREVERAMRRSKHQSRRQNHNAGKSKRDREPGWQDDWQDDEVGTGLSLSQIEGTGTNQPRITSEGEFTESFLREIEEEEQRRQM